MNDENLNEFVRNVTDTYLYETLVAIFCLSKDSAENIASIFS